MMLFRNRCIPLYPPSWLVAERFPLLGHQIQNVGNVTERTVDKMESQQPNRHQQGVTNHGTAGIHLTTQPRDGVTFMRRS